MNIIIPGEEYQMRMSIKAFAQIAHFVLDHEFEFKKGEKFTIEGTDKKKLIIIFED